jgi:hypothetical protein
LVFVGNYPIARPLNSTIGVNNRTSTCNLTEFRVFGLGDPVKIAPVRRNAPNFPTYDSKLESRKLWLKLLQGTDAAARITTETTDSNAEMVATLGLELTTSPCWLQGDLQGDARSSSGGHPRTASSESPRP